jgi:molybdopterin/thiamine biosynthesis adenylyltransferase
VIFSQSKVKMMPFHDWTTHLMLARARVVVFGRGELGSAAVELLAQAGVGHPLNVLLPQNLNKEPAGALIAGASLVLDGSGRTDARHWINRACFKAGIPWIFGGLRDCYGVMMNFIPGKTPCFDCAFGALPEKPAKTTNPCSPPAAAHVLASLQVEQAVQILIGGEPCLNRLVVVDAAAPSLETVMVKSQKGVCPVCGWQG